MTPPAAGPDRRRAARRLDPWPGWLVALLLTLVGGALRFTRLDYLGFRIDEGFTMTYARQPWRGVIGLDGFYSPHPPLFFTLAKVADLLVREEIASRVVAAVAGTLTIPVLYALVARLLDRRAALAATVLLVISPLHIQFSRDGRMYATVVLMVALSYLALVTHRQAPRRAWLVVYGAALFLAVAIDYSAAFALTPQAALLLWFAREDPRRARGPLVAVGVAVAAYLPWIPQVVDTIDRTAHATARDDYLAASWSRIGVAFTELTGLDARAVWRTGGHPSPWDRWEGARVLLVIGLLPVAVAGVVALRRRGPALGMAAAMTLGPPLVAIAASLISPGFASRTVMTAVLGWAIVAGAVFLRGRVPWAVRVAGGLGWVYVVAISLLALPATYEEGRREQWREVSAELAAHADLGKPVVIFSTAGMLTDMVDLYAGDELDGAQVVTLLDGERERWTGAERWLDRGPTLADIEAGALASLFPPDDPGVDALWLIRRFGGRALSTRFIALGYQPVGTIAFISVQLELWARPGAVIGDAIPLGDVGLDADDGGSWRASRDATRIGPAATGGGVLLLDAVGARGLTVVPAGPGLYLAESEVWVSGAGAGRLTLQCLAGDGSVSTRETNTAGFDVSSPGYRPVLAAVRCTEGTTALEIVLDRQGPSRVGFRAVRMSGSPDGAVDRA